LAVLVDFLISFIVLIFMMLVYQRYPSWQAFLIIPFTLMAVLTALAVGLWLSALNVQYRDVQHLVPFLVQIWMYASPIVYPIDIVPEGIWRTLYGLNPMVGVIQGFRWALFGETPPDVTMIVSAVVVVVLFVSGIFYFRKMEKTFADVV
jgi:lipopolysaccharide transport system permease protein